MTSPKTLLIALLALTTVTAGAIAWNQSLELRRARQDAAQLALERDDLQTQLAAARRPGGFNVNVAQSDTAIPAAATEVALTPKNERRERQQREPENGPGRGLGRMEELMKNPEFAAAMTAQAKSRLDRQYADLFKRLNLPPAQLEQLKSLLAEKQTARLDVMAAARAEGLDFRDNRAEIAALMRQTQGEIDLAINEAIGADAFAAYQAYEQTAPQRAAVSSLEQRLSYTATPLTQAQSDQLVTLLAPSRTANTASAPTAIPERASSAGRNSGIEVITDQAVTQAAAILAPAQLQALKELQATQQAGRVLGEAFRNGGGPPAGPPGDG